MRNIGPNPFRIIINFCWTLILILFIAVTIFVNVHNGTYQNTWNDLTKQEIENEDSTSEENVDSEVDINMEDATITVE